ncbi:metal ABC transporter ATP-binding protein [[Clostridium] aminophilum]|uniref:metal ABC transporter ATP-binding protein n=1 Tax=[Clostridium] aminophilum TaxID=1526 RepID=UPI0026ECE15D|nr:ABC transporter ATP-binding protein [[Clostridium] aminophilum]MDD6195602.1 ABC transporter ATP-binding protein [[Clostridium] aminophilum]
MSLIQCKNVSFAYEGQTAVSDITFEVNPGDYLCIVGENGAGKSTLMKGLLRLKKPAGGSIEFGDGLLANEIGYLPQQTVVQKDFPASVREVVQSGCLNHLGWNPFYTAAHKKEALEKMELLGITDLADRCYRDLSGGQQQRVLLARALCATKRLLLLDEPVTGLDPAITVDLYHVISELHRKHGITIVMVSHDVDGALRESDHILHIAGTQKYFGTTEEYKKTPACKAFLGGLEL